MATNQQLEDTINTNPSNNPTQGTPVIDANNITGNQQLQLPNQTTDFAMLLQSLLSNAGATQNSLTSQLEAQKQKEQTATDKAFQSYITSLSGGGLEQDFNQLSQQAGLTGMQTQLGQINQQLATKTAMLNTALNQAEDRNVFLGFAEGEQNRLRRNTATELGALAATAQVLSGNIEQARSTIRDVLNFRSQDKQNKINQAKAFYEINADKLSKTETALLNAKIREDEREQKKLDDLNDFKEGLASSVLKNGAPAKVLEGIMNAEDKASALKLSAGYGMSPKERLEIQKLGMEIDEKTQELLLKAQNAIGGSTGDAVADVIIGSSKYGKSNLTDTQLTKIQQATNALGSLQTLQGLLAQGKDGIKSTGVVSGRARNLIAQLGGDANAAAINATIQGLVPTVARGIFGEVGVLTNADIENYKKTLPNLTSSEDQNKLISIMMYDVLSRSIGNTLMTNAQNQVNVSNFYPTYKKSQETINQLKSELGYVEAEDEVTKNYLDNKLGGGVVGNINSSVSNYASQFTR